MAQTIILKNTTGSNIKYGGRLIPAGDQNEFDGYDPHDMRELGEQGLYADIIAGDIIVNDGTKDLSADAGRSYIANEFDVGAPIIVNNTGAIVIPLGTTAQRPSSPIEGMLRKNTDLAAMELYQDGIWTPVGIFGMWYTLVESVTVTTTDQITYFQKLRLTTPNVVAGTYRISWSYQWNHNAAGNDFESRIQLDDTTDLMYFKQEPKDARHNDGPTNPLPDEVDAGGGNYQYSTTGSAQRYEHTGVAHPVLGAGVHTFDLDFRTDTGGSESSIWNARMEFWRIR